MWPLFIGLQVVKTALLVLFLPSIIGSVGKIVGKGLPSLSGTFTQFSQPAAHVESVDDLDFKDNSANSDHESDGTLNSVYQYAIPGEWKSPFFATIFFFNFSHTQMQRTISPRKCTSPHRQTMPSRDLDSIKSRWLRRTKTDFHQSAMTSKFSTTSHHHRTFSWIMTHSTVHCYHDSTLCFNSSA